MRQTHKALKAGLFIDILQGAAPHTAPVAVSPPAPAVTNDAPGA